MGEEGNDVAAILCLNLANPYAFDVGESHFGLGKGRQQLLRIELRQVQVQEEIFIEAGIRSHCGFVQGFAQGFGVLFKGGQLGFAVYSRLRFKNVG